MNGNKEDIIFFIKRLKRFLIKSKLFENENEIIYFFSYGGCLILANMLKIKYPKSKLVINYEQNHCAISCNGKIYDIRGNITGSEKFKAPDISDYKYMNQNFGFYQYSKIKEYIFILKILKHIKNNNIKINLKLPNYNFYNENIDKALEDLIKIPSEN